MMNRFLIVLLCYIVGVQSKCYTGPAEKLPEGCKVGNLTVAVDHSYEIINRLRCNTTADESASNYPPRDVRFQYVWGNYQGSKFLLSVVDHTSKEVVWMMSNLTIGPEYKIIPCNNGRYCREIIPWRKPYLTPYSRQHVLEFIVLEERRNQPYRTYTYSPALYASPFNLSVWINSQQNSGITICGPVGGGSVVLTQFPPAPPSGSNTTPSPYHPGPSHHNRRKNNSNRNLCNGMLLTALVLFVISRH